MTDRYERIRAVITFCDNCGCDWLDNGLHPVSCPYCRIRELRAERDRLAAALEAAREDAERYRWLRDREIPEWLDLWHQNPDRIDAAIDQARGKGIVPDAPFAPD